MKTRNELMFIAGLIAIFGCAGCGSDDDDNPSCKDDASVCTEGYACEKVDGSYECVEKKTPKDGDENGKCLAENKCNGDLVCKDSKCIKDSSKIADGDENGKCLANNKCNGELVCKSDKCVKDNAPAAGDEGGACLAENKCNGDDLVCKDSKCIKPAAGDEGGSCLAENKCNDYLACENSKCVAIPNGDEGGHCLAEDKCNDITLSCKEDKCAFDINQVIDTICNIRHQSIQDGQPVVNEDESKACKAQHNIITVKSDTVCSEAFVNDSEKYLICEAKMLSEANARLDPADSHYTETLETYISLTDEYCEDFSNYASCLEGQKLDDAQADYRYNYYCKYQQKASTEEAITTCVNTASASSNLFTPFTESQTCAEAFNKDLYNYYIYSKIYTNKHLENISDSNKKIYLGENYFKCLIEHDDNKVNTDGTRDFSTVIKILCENDPNVVADKLEECIEQHTINDITHLAPTAPCADKYEEGTLEYVILRYFTPNVTENAYIRDYNSKYLQCLIDNNEDDKNTETILGAFCNITLTEEAAINGCTQSRYNSLNYTASLAKFCTEETRNLLILQNACSTFSGFTTYFNECNEAIFQASLDKLSCAAQYGKEIFDSIEGSDISNYNTMCNFIIPYMSPMTGRDNLPDDYCINSILQDFAQISIKGEECINNYYSYIDENMNCIAESNISSIFDYLAVEKKCSTQTFDDETCTLSNNNND